MLENEKHAKSDNNINSNYIDTKDPIINTLFFGKYKAIKKLGEGSFGKVYKVEYNNKTYAMKLESKRHSQGLLESEATIMTYLKGPNIPNVVFYGQYQSYNILIMQLMGKSLEDLINIHKTFTIKTVCMLGYQMINNLNYIHERHIIHRDIKPDNFVMGINENNAYLYIIDFGLSKKYRSSKTLIQYPLIKRKKLVGTARYASIHALEELEQSRRDDLESVGYVLIYFLKGCLPWQGLKVKVKEERYKKILEKKRETTSEELCHGLPYIFEEFVSYTRNLDYLEEPNYDNLRNLFYNYVTNEMNESFDFIYDWTTTFDIKKRKDYNNDLLSNYQCSEKKSVKGKENESLLKKNKKEELTTTNGNNLTLYKTIQTEGNGNLNNSRYNISNLNVIIENKKLDENASSRCCIMYNIFFNIFFRF